MHKPDFLTAQNLSRALGVSTAFLYATEDDVAELVFRYRQASASEKQKVQKLLADLPGPPKI